VRSARDDARNLHDQDVSNKATAVRKQLNQLRPYYDRTTKALTPVTR
jgi:hypothetical protein